MNRSTRTVTSPRSDRASVRPVLPTVESDPFDDEFSQIICRLFPPRFTFGAGVLLGSYAPSEPPPPEPAGSTVWPIIRALSFRVWRLARQRRPEA